jgi:hypothetical protein
MGNIITSNPMFFDEVTSSVENELLNKMSYVERVEWVSNEAGAKDIAADDDMLVTNYAGNDLYSKRAEFAGDDYTTGKINPPDPVLGIKILKLDGGIMKIWLSPFNRG